MKRFWATVTVEDGGIRLDERPVRTPGRAPLALPAPALAEAVAEEWRGVGETIDPAVVAACGSLAPSAVSSSYHPPVFVSVGLPFAVAELGSLADLAAAGPDSGAFAAADQRYPTGFSFSLMLYVRVDGDPFTLRARMFAPLSNIPEDPATGSAAGALCTYLATLVPNFSDALKHAVVAGAVIGGGLTVIANAPNPAGQSILSDYFEDGVSPLKLFLGALLPTFVLALCFLLLP